MQKTFFGIDWSGADTTGVSTQAWYETAAARDEALARRRERATGRGLSKNAVTAGIVPVEHTARGAAEVAEYEARAAY